jgi:hypothetical protein
MVAITLKRIKDKAKGYLPGKKRTEPLPDDIHQMKPETEIRDDRSSFRFSSIVDHVKKNWADLKSLRNKF